MASFTGSGPHPFLPHLAAVLSIYELSPDITLIPKYDGPADIYTTTILRSVANIAKRMVAAEAALSAQKAVHDSGSHTVGKADATTATPPSILPTTVTLSSEQAAVMDGPLNAGPSLITPPVLLAAPSSHPITDTVKDVRLLKTQVCDIARVCNAVSHGDLSQTVTGPVRGPVMTQLKDVVNTMVERLNQVTTEITRACLALGTEGILPSQPVVPDAEGRWQELTNAVNTLSRKVASQKILSHDV
ncbi:hypothetical protein BC629DRAFT_1590870 [Irpex lacteus]|nr:hypothetical protein BC629DRAFT_1590870 [Irpex lacteus]